MTDVSSWRALRARAGTVVLRSDLRDRPLARPGEPAGLAWSLATGLAFFMTSNPLVLVPGFHESLEHASWGVVAAAVVGVRWLRLPRLPWAVVAFLAWATLSWTWSIAPETTSGSLRLYVAVAVLALVVAGNASPATIARGAAWGGVAILVASWIAYEREMPGAGVLLGMEGSLAGIGTNRNILSYSLVLALGFAVCLDTRTWLRRLHWVVVVGLLLVGIWVAGSGTGKVTAVLVLVALVLGRAAPRLRVAPGWPRRLLVLAPVVLVVVALASFERVVGALGRDTTLSGRTPFWDAIVEVTAQQWTHGYGWGAVWQYQWAPAWDNPVRTEIFERAGTAYSHGHNSWLDLYPMVGLVGVLLAAAVFVELWVRAARLRPSSARGGREHDVRDVWCLVVTVPVAHLMFGITEPMVAIPLGWFVMVLLAGVAANAGASAGTGSPEPGPPN